MHLQSTHDPHRVIGMDHLRALGVDLSQELPDTLRSQLGGKSVVLVADGVVFLLACGKIHLIKACPDIEEGSSADNRHLAATLDVRNGRAAVLLE